jgi:hypothetical protein
MSSHVKGKAFEEKVLKTIRKYGFHEEKDPPFTYWDRTGLIPVGNNLELIIGGEVLQEEDVFTLFIKGRDWRENVYIQCKDYNKELGWRDVLNEIFKTGAAGIIAAEFYERLANSSTKIKPERELGINEIIINRVLPKDTNDYLRKNYPNIIPKRKNKVKILFGELVVGKKKGKLHLETLADFANENVQAETLDLMHALAPVNHYLIVTNENGVTQGARTLIENFEANTMMYAEFAELLKKGELLDSLNKFVSYGNHAKRALEYRALNAFCNLAEDALKHEPKYAPLFEKPRRVDGKQMRKLERKLKHEKRRMSEDFLGIKF